MHKLGSIYCHSALILLLCTGKIGLNFICQSEIFFHKNKCVYLHTFIVVDIPGMLFTQIMEILMALGSHGTFQKEEPVGDIDGSFRMQASYAFGNLQKTHPPRMGRGLQPGRILQEKYRDQVLCGVLGYFFKNTHILY